MYPERKKINIVIVDDHPIVMEGLQKLLHNGFDIGELKQFSSGDEFLSFLRKDHEPIHVVVLDINIPDRNGIDVCREIKLTSQDTIVLGFSNHAERSIILQMLQNGANGYLLKNASASEIIAAIKEAMDGHLAFSKEVREILARPTVTELMTVPRLTKREKEILKLIAKGKTSVEIGDMLFVSPLTVETHRRNLMHKFKVKNAAALISVAAQLQQL